MPKTPPEKIKIREKAKNFLNDYVLNDREQNEIADYFMSTLHQFLVDIMPNYKEILTKYHPDRNLQNLGHNQCIKEILNRAKDLYGLEIK